MEGARGDEENVIGLYRAILGHDRAALYDGQYVALNALAGDVDAARIAAGDFIDFVDKDYAVVFGAAYGFGLDGVVVDEFIRLLRH